MVLVVKSQPFGLGTFGSVDTEVFSVLWIPTQGDGSEGSLDAIIPETDSTGPFSVSERIESAPAAYAPRFLTVEQTDPQAVFSTEQVDSPIIESQRLMPDESSIKLTTSDREISSAWPQQAVVVESSNANTPEDELASASELTGMDRDQNFEAQLENGLTNDGEDGHGTATAAGGRQTQFFGISANSRRVVYVIDASESMRQHHAMELARRRLWESLQQLTSEFQFQIVFFNLTTHTLGRGRDKTKLLPATSVNLRVAKQFLTGIQPDSGTDRLAAILLALSYKPDTVFVLTDADAPELDAQELRDIQRRNNSNATIHVVEFGIQADLSRDSFLKRLARQNGGRHRYHDLTRGER